MVVRASIQHKTTLVQTLTLQFTATTTCTIRFEKRLTCSAAKKDSAVMFASNPDGKEWRRSEWQLDPRDSRYAERLGHPQWVKFCWGGEVAEALYYPRRTLIVSALDETGLYVAYVIASKKSYSIKIFKKAVV